MVGSAVVFFYQHYREVHQPCPASFVQAVSFQQLPAYKSQGLKEMTISRALVQGRYQRCLVLMIEPGRSLEEQTYVVQRDRSHFEERGIRGAALAEEEMNEERERGGEAPRDEMEEESGSSSATAFSDTADSDTEMVNAQAAPRASLPASGFRQNKFTNISSPSKRGTAVAHPATSEHRPRRIIVATNQRKRVMSEPRPNEITDGESESGEKEEGDNFGSDESIEAEDTQPALRVSFEPSTSGVTGLRRNNRANLSSLFERGALTGTDTSRPTVSEPPACKRPVVARVTSRHIRGVSGSVAKPNEVTVDESGNDDGEEEQDDDFDSRSRSMVSTIHKRSKKQMAYKDVQNMPKSARKPGPAKKGRRPVTASAVGKKLYPVAIPGVDGTMVNLENLVERMAAESSSKLKAARMALTAIFPEEEIQTSVCSSRGSKAGAPSYDKDKLAALYECYREYARRVGIRMPVRRDFHQLCCKVKVFARKKGGLPAQHSGR